MIAALVAALVPWTGTRARLAPRQDERAREAPASEGALDNDVFVPLSSEAAQALASGDQALARARKAAAAGPPAEVERQLDLALDQWRAALVAGGAGASIRYEPEGSGDSRLSEGVRAAVVRRVSALEPRERARWTARHGAAAEQALGALADNAPSDERALALAEVARLFPLTPAAARAALQLGDLALEAGLTTRALGWYARSAREAELAAAADLLAVARARSAAHAPRASADEPWRHARACEFADSVGWTDPGQRGRARGPSDAERWLRPGGAFLGETRLAVQTAAELLLFSVEPTGKLALDVRVRPGDLLGGSPGDFEAPREPPGWPLLPLADEQGVVLVVGRAGLGEPNALLALALDLPARPDLGLELGAREPLARLTWAVTGAERVEARGTTPVPELEELGDYEFQPGPVECGEQVLVQARRFDGQVKSYLLAFDRRDGRLAWKRELAAGADRVATQRFALSSKRVAGEPLLALELDGEPLVFAGTHLGLGVLVDALAGEPLWSFKNRRRDARDPGWGGERPLNGTGAEDPPLVLWAPMDSDRLYTLVPRALAAPTSGAPPVLARAPEPLGEAQTLLGGDAREHLVLGRAGGERSVSALRAGLDRVDALDLGQDERFVGTGLVSAERAWVSTSRGLYLLDRTRELYLLDREPLPPAGGESQGGDVLARGTHVFVLGASALWSFRVR